MDSITVSWAAAAGPSGTAAAADGANLLAALALAAALAPGLLGFALSRLLGLGAVAARRATAVGALLSLGLAFAVLLHFAFLGRASDALLWIRGPGDFRISLGATVDGLTATLLATVTLIGAVVARYSVRYLDGDPHQARFCQWLAYTLSAVLLLVVSSNLLMLFAGWVATSHGLHRLLTHCPDRPAAWLAARKKFLISRLGDCLLASAFVLVGWSFGTFEFAEIFAAARNRPPEGDTLAIVSALLVLGAMTKSAQFPFHTWLPDSMEAPTPVSALMHAGIINAGGFLLIRMSPLLVTAPAALTALALGGAFTALFGSLVMLTQTDVKRKFAWSTVSQMGFMMLQCGLGAFAAATLHLVGHAFYKGHAFLSSGSAVDPAPAPRTAAPRSRRSTLPAVALAVGAGVAVVVGAALLLGVAPDSKPGLPVLGSVLALAVAQMLLGGRSAPGRSGPALLPALATGAAIAVVYFAGVGLFERLLQGAIPDMEAVSGAAASGGAGIATLLVGLFFLALLVQERVKLEEAGSLARAAYVHASNGFYLGTLQNRLVQRLWPVPIPARATKGVHR